MEPFKGLAALGGIPAPEPLGMPRGGPKTLLITGAGASKAWGHPLTDEIAPLLKRLNHRLPLDMMRDCQELIAYAENSGAFRGSDGKSFDFEEYCSWLVAAGIEDDVNWWSKRNLPEADRPKQDAEFYYRMTMFSFWLVLAHTDRLQQGPDLLEFAQRIPSSYANLEKEFGTIAGVVTMNYDMVPEHLLSNRGIDYGFRQDDLLVAESFQEGRFDMKESLEKARASLGDLGSAGKIPDAFLDAIRWQDYMRVQAAKRFQPGMVPVLKLHGSMNMNFCPKCRKAIVYPPILKRKAPAQWLFPGWEFGSIRSSGFLATFHCADPDGERGPPNDDQNRLWPVAIPPIANKEEHPAWEAMASVHERAIEEAAKHERVVVIGTSIRPSDRILGQVLKAVTTTDVAFVGDSRTYERLKAVIPTAKHVRQRL